MSLIGYNQPRPCGHCGRPCGDMDGGWGSVEHVDLCHPNEPGRPDCYHLVTLYKHPLRNCPKCTAGQNYAFVHPETP